MNDKFQKALNRIVKSSCPNCHDENGCASCDIEKICNATAKYWVNTLQALIDQNKVYTLEEVKKEWEEMNCEWLETDKHIFIHSKESFDGIKFPTVALLYKENKTYVSNYIFDIKTHKLLTETMKSLGWFDE